MSTLERLQQARKSAQPAQAYRSLIQSLSLEGMRKQQVYEEFERFLSCLRAQADFQEDDEEYILDVMDALSDWCHPDCRLPRDDSPA